MIRLAQAPVSTADKSLQQDADSRAVGATLSGNIGAAETLAATATGPRRPGWTVPPRTVGAIAQPLRRKLR